MSDQRFNTGNPIGSNSPLDRSDNTRNLDVAVNAEQLTWVDRLGRDRKSFEGMEREFDSAQAYRENEFDSAQHSRDARFNDFISASGYQFLGEYAAGVVLSEYNQIVRDESGEFWRVSGQVDLPYVTTGSGIPEGDALVPVGDAVLRQELTDPNQGAAMVSYGGGTVADKLDELDVQSDALAKLTNRLKRSVLENGIARLLPNGGYSYVAHRGFSHFAPENTIPSFAAAARSGFKFVECDLINTGDGDFVIIHDNTLDRTTDSTGDVREMTIAQIKAATVDFGAGMISAVLSNLPTLFPALKIPTLEEFLKCCHNFGLHPIIEAKLYTPELRDQFFKRVMQILPLGGFSLLSSDITSLNHYRSMSDAVTLGWLASPTSSNIDVCASLGNSFISFSSQDAALNAAAVRLAKEKGVLTNVWVVNNSRTAQDMIALQIDLISTDSLI